LQNVYDLKIVISMRCDILSLQR